MTQSVSEKTNTPDDVPNKSDETKDYHIQHVEIPASITGNPDDKPMYFVIKKPNPRNIEQDNDFQRIESTNNDSTGSKDSNSSTVVDSNKSNSSTVDDDNESSPRFATPIMDGDVSSKESEEKEEVSQSDTSK